MVNPVCRAIEFLCQREPALRSCILERRLVQGQIDLIVIAPREEIAQYIFAKRGEVVKKMQSLSLARRMLILSNGELFASCSCPNIPTQVKRFSEEVD